MEDRNHKSINSQTHVSKSLTNGCCFLGLGGTAGPTFFRNDKLGFGGNSDLFSKASSAKFRSSSFIFHAPITRNSCNQQ